MNMKLCPKHDMAFRRFNSARQTYRLMHSDPEPAQAVHYIRERLEKRVAACSDCKPKRHTSVLTKLGHGPY